MPYARRLPSRAMKMMIQKRKAQFVHFPIGCEISYKNSDDSFGIVVSYDLRLGRLLTNQGGSFDPIAMKVLHKSED